MALVNTLAIRLEAITSNFTAGFEKATGAVTRIAGGLDNFGKKTEEANRRATEAAKNITNLGGAASGIGDAFQAIAAASSVAGQGVGQFGAVTDDILEKTRSLEDSIRTFAGDLETELAGIAGKAAPAAQGLFKIAEEAAALGPKGIPVIDKIIAKLEELNRVPGKSAGAFDVTITAIRKLRTEAELVGKPVSTLTKFTQAFIGTVRQGDTPLTAFIAKNQTLGGVLSNLKGFIGSLNPVMAGLVGIIGLLGAIIFRAVRQVVTIAGEFNSLSKRTGFTVEALSQLKFVAEQNNASFADLETGLQNFNRTLGQALSGNKASIKALEALGVSVDDIRKNTNEDILNKVADGLKDTASSAQRAARGADVFGTRQRALIQVMSQGSEVIAEQRREADELGATFTGKLALAADQLQGNLRKLETLQQALAIRIAEEVVPALNEFLVGIIPLLRDGLPGLIEVIRQTAFEATKLGAGLEVLAASARIVKATVDQDEEAFDAAAEAMDKAFKKLGQTREEFDALSKAAAANVPILNSNADAMGNLSDQLSQLADQFSITFAQIAGEADPRASGLVELAKQFATLGPKGRKAIQEIIAEFERLNRVPSVTVGEFTTTIKKLQEIAAQATPLAGLTTETTKLAETLDAGSKAAVAAATAILEIGTPQSIQQFNTLIGRLVELGQAGDEAAKRVARALVPLEGPEFPPEEQARREAEFRGAGPQIPADIRGFREEDLRRQQFDVGPEVPENLERVPNIFGEIILLTEEAKIGFAALETVAGGFGSALADVFSAKNKKAFIDFFKSLRDQIIAAIAKALILRTILSILPGGGIFGGIGKLLKGGFDSPGPDAFAQNEGARFGLLFGRGLRSTLGQTAFAGIGANLGTANVVIEPQIVVQNAGPLARVEWFDRGQEQRLRRRQEELGGAPL